MVRWSIPCRDVQLVTSSVHRIGDTTSAACRIFVQATKVTKKATFELRQSAQSSRWLMQARLPSDGLSSTRKLPETAAGLVRIGLPVAKSPSHQHAPRCGKSGRIRERHTALRPRTPLRMERPAIRATARTTSIWEELRRPLELMPIGRPPHPSAAASRYAIKTPKQCT